MPPLATTPAIGSLCSGYGGLDLAVQQVWGGSVAWHAETDPHASRVLTRHWSAPNLGDITAVDWSAVQPVCVLTAGFPCQDLSVAGTRAGLEGDRSGLWHTITHCINILKPCMVVLENVRGILSAPAAARRDLEPCPWHLGDRPTVPVRALGAVLGDLADLGYDANWSLLAASDVGAPHRRERVFVTAWPTHPSGAGRHRPECAARGPRPGGGTVEDSDLEPRLQRRQSAPGQAPQRRPRPEPAGRDRAPAAHPQGHRRHQGLPEPALRQRRPHPASGSSPTPRNREESEAVDWGRFQTAVRRWERLTRPAPRPTDARGRLSPVFVEWLLWACRPAG
jgi:DNA (cytosine-5)-methyltransferase 1